MSLPRHLLYDRRYKVCDVVLSSVNEAKLQHDADILTYRVCNFLSKNMAAEYKKAARREREMSTSLSVRWQ